jgi:hypothetical protein
MGDICCIVSSCSFAPFKGRVGHDVASSIRLKSVKCPLKYLFRPKFCELRLFERRYAEDIWCLNTQSTTRGLEDSKV